MVQPNSACIGFCYWMLYVSNQKLSGPQRIIVETVYSAAISVTPVSDQTWYNFNLFSAWRNKYYEVYRDYAFQVMPSLLTGLIASWSFDGNSNDATGIYNGTDTGVSYTSTNALINQAVDFPGTASSIAFGPMPSLSDFTVNLWFRPSFMSPGVAFLFSQASNGRGLYFNWSNQTVGFSNSASLDTVSAIPLNEWCNITVLQSGGIASIYVNGVLSAGPAPGFAPIAFSVMGYNGFGALPLGLMDIATVWDRSLTNDEIQFYYNSGSGRQYPF